MREYSHAIFIGRFQPFHDSHLVVVNHGLEIAEHLIIIVGSSTAARSIKNPFTFEERKAMILEALPKALRSRVSVYGVRDYYYNQNAWLASVQAVTDSHIVPGESVALLGSFKDASSYYLRSFPQWDHVASLPGLFHGTEIRNMWYESGLNGNGHLLTDWEGVATTYDPLLMAGLPLNVLKTMNEFAKTSIYAELVKEWKFTKDYKKSWESAPYPPTFVTTDCVVVCSGHVLVVQRKFNPGKGLYALPGGFLKQDELIRAGALRELKEETGIRIDKRILDSHIADSQVFDHPDRSLRGRTITHSFYIKLPDGDLPEVKGNDDAEKTKWLPLWDVMTHEDRFFEDHAHIINHFVGV